MIAQPFQFDLMNAKQIRAMLKEAEANGKNLYWTWNSRPNESFRCIDVKTIGGVVWAKSINGSSFMVSDNYTFDIR